MSAIIIGGVTLPEGMTWTNEFDYTPVAMTKDFTLTGSILVQTQIATAGRVIKIEGTQDHGWIQKSKFDQLRVNSQSNSTFVFTDSNGNNFNVVWDHSSGHAVTGSPLQLKSIYQPTDYFSCSLTLLTV